MYYLIMAVIVAVDQAVKYIVDTKLAVGESLPVVSKIFHITYVQNRGAAFSTFMGQRIMLIIFPIVLIAALAFYYYKFGKNEHWTLRLAISFIVAGGIGNLIDRLVRGFVVDMFDFIVWPVFNVADIAVCTGCGVLLLYVIFFDKSEKPEKCDE